MGRHHFTVNSIEQSQMGRKERKDNKNSARHTFSFVCCFFGMMAMRDLLLCTLLALNLAVLLRWHERVGLFPQADPADAAGGVIIGAEELTPFELGHGSMRVMWSTPLLRLNLLNAALQGANPQQQQQRYGEMLALLLASVREGHARVAEEYAGNLTEDPASANGLNGVFFRWQTRHANPGWPSMFRTPESAAAL